MAGSMCGRHRGPNRICHAFMNKNLFCAMGLLVFLNKNTVSKYRLQIWVKFVTFHPVFCGLLVCLEQFYAQGYYQIYRHNHSLAGKSPFHRSSDIPQRFQFKPKLKFYGQRAAVVFSKSNSFSDLCFKPLRQHVWCLGACE